MPNDNLPRVIQHLLDPGAYSHEVDAVKLVQTHISYVLLAGNYVYKFKKPVNFGFLDFTTLKKRRYFCEQELLLNRRLCPSLYLGLVSVNDQEGRLSLNGPGQAVEFGVKMRRMPEECMMGNIISAGRLTVEMIDSIAATLIPFYQQAETGPEIQEYGTASAVSVNVLENFQQTEQFVGGTALHESQFEMISRYARDFLKKEDLFRVRIEAGRIRDCHGDLYSANICLADQVYIYDCIEFNKRFRYCDVASDIAFLAMDLDFHGLDDQARHFIEHFRVASRDDGLLDVLNFYKCYRAYVRGKIGLFTAHAPEVDDTTKERSLAQSRKYFELAARYAAG